MSAERARLLDVCRLFLRLGLTTFGGPAAHIAAMEDEVVRRRAWVTREEFADLLSVSMLLPGPNSTELALELGYRRAGWKGLLAAGVCFISPAVLAVWGLAWLYTSGSASSMMGIAIPRVLLGMQPVVLAVIVQAVWRLARTVVSGWRAAAIATSAAVAVLFGIHELLVLAAAALLGATKRLNTRSAMRALVPYTIVAPAALETPALASTGGIFVAFLKIGALLFGSGYTLVAFLRAEFVERNAWLSEGQLLDAITVGQVTPGPLFSSATFVGFLLGGHTGALAATIAIFLPAFLFVAASGPLVRWLRTSPAARALLDALNAASLGLLAAASLLSGRALVGSALAVALFAVAALVLLFTRVGAAWLLVAGALAGLAAWRFPAVLELFHR